MGLREHFEKKASVESLLEVGRAPWFAGGLAAIIANTVMNSPSRALWRAKRGIKNGLHEFVYSDLSGTKNALTGLLAGTGAGHLMDVHLPGVSEQIASHLPESMQGSGAMTGAGAIGGLIAGLVSAQAKNGVIDTIKDVKHLRRLGLSDQEINRIAARAMDTTGVK